MNKKPTIFRDGNQVIYGIELARLDANRIRDSFQAVSGRAWKRAALALLALAILEGLIAWAAWNGLI